MIAGREGGGAPKSGKGSLLSTEKANAVVAELALSHVLSKQGTRVEQERDRHTGTAQAAEGPERAVCRQCRKPIEM